MLANEFISVERTCTHKHIHSQKKSYRYLEQWFRFLFPPPHRSTEKQGQECRSLTRLCFERKGCIVTTLRRRTHRRPDTRSKTNQVSCRSQASKKGGGKRAHTSPGSVSFTCGFLNLIWFVFLYLRCTFVTSDLCIVLFLSERRKVKRKKTQALPCLKILILILFLYPNDVVYFAFSKPNLNDICKNVQGKGKGLLSCVDPLTKSVLKLKRRSL